MKLVKIEDVRIGQIYKSKKYNYIHIITSFSDVRYTLSDFYRNGILECENDWELTNSEIEACELIGFLGITHEKRDNKLIEIPREELEKDDIIEINMEKYIITNIKNFITKDVVLDKLIQGHSLSVLDSDGHYDTYLFEIDKKNYKKIGILGVNYEFINNKLVKENE